MPSTCAALLSTVTEFLEGREQSPAATESTPKSDYEKFLAFIEDAPNVDPSGWNNREIDTAYVKSSDDWSPERLGTLYQEGDSRATLRLKLGWQLKVEDNKALLIPPPDFKTYVKAFYQHVYEQIEAGELKWGDVVLPALIFTPRSSPNRSIVAASAVFVRPWIDPMPDPRLFQLASFSDDMPHKTWVDAIASGRIPTDLSYSLEHDTGHLLDLLQPARMKATRHYYQTAQKLDWVNANSSFSQFILNTTQYRAANRIMVAAEFNSLPRLLAESEMRELFPFMQVPRDSDLIEFSEMRNRIIEITADDFDNMLKKWLKGPDEILVRQGGAMHDDWNFERYSGTRLAVRRVFHSVEKGVSRETLTRYFSSDYDYYGVANAEKAAREVLHVLYEELLLIQRLRSNFNDTIQSLRNDYPSHVYRLFLENHARAIDQLKQQFDTLEAMSPGEREDFLSELLRERLAELMTAIYNGNKIGITPERILEDISLAQLPPDSPTARYYRSWVAPGSFLYQTFVED
ncbi:MAG: hypothetical protein EA369_09500 [Bradymonadales bacterium]|nr:MAG: hypothetical protein EA369_09500 [Bradymonadales bacterium]